jgi:flagellar basal-body rod protein FlgB
MVRTQQTGWRSLDVEPIHLLDLASQQARWLSIRQATVAANVSNANTPGYKAMDVKPFADVLEQTQLQLVATNPGHLAAEATPIGSQVVKPSDPWEVTESGNSVSVEEEMMRAGDINRGFSLNTSIVKAFHGMLLASVKE